LLDHAEALEEIGEIKAAIIDTVDRLGRWVSALVSYLHPLKPQPVLRNPTVLMDAAVDLLHNRLRERSLQIVRRPWDTAACVKVDPDLMEQAIYGLLSNALDASPEASTIFLGVMRDGNYVRLTITDQGPGMPFQPKPSELAPGPSTKRFGTGLGIPIAFKVCKAHGWRLEFDRGDNGGTKAIITAPVASRIPAHV